MNFLTITTDTWMMAGFSIAVVLGILILLVVVLKIFSAIASLGHIKRSPRVLEVNEAPAQPLAAGEPDSSPEDQRLAAVAMALHLYLSNQHDEESGVLTIPMHDLLGGWHEELNKRL